MIVRERNDQFVMIEQHHHASISGKLFTYLKEDFLPESKWKEDIEFAIFHHDCGWIPFDEAPFWDDKSNTPYSFTSLPKAPKTVLYENGINKVEEHSMYAALLCSNHYSTFMNRHSIKPAENFIEREKLRQERLRKKIHGFQEDAFNLHYKLVKFFDDFSLYICLNEPGVQKEKEHPFFKKGIPLPDSFGDDLLKIRWNSESEINIDHTLFYSPEINIQLKQKVLSKANIIKNGLIKTYEAAESETVNIRILSSV